MIRFSPSNVRKPDGTKTDREACEGDYCYCVPPCPICLDFLDDGHTNYGQWLAAGCPTSGAIPTSCFEECRPTLKICNEQSPEQFNNVAIYTYADKRSDCLECCPESPAITGMTIDFSDDADARLGGQLNGPFELEQSDRDGGCTWFKLIPLSPQPQIAIGADSVNCPRVNYNLDFALILARVTYRPVFGQCTQPDALDVNLNVYFYDTSFTSIACDPQSLWGCCIEFLETPFGAQAVPGQWNIRGQNWTQAAKDKICASQVLSAPIVQAATGPDEMVVVINRMECLEVNLPNRLCRAEDVLATPSSIDLTVQRSNALVWGLGPRAIVNFEDETKFGEARIVPNPDKSSNEIGIELWHNEAKLATSTKWYDVGSNIGPSFPLALEACITKTGELRGYLERGNPGEIKVAAQVPSVNANGRQTGFGIVGTSRSQNASCVDVVGFIVDNAFFPYFAQRIDDKDCVCPEANECFITQYGDTALDLQDVETDTLVIETQTVNMPQNSGEEMWHIFDAPDNVPNISYYATRLRVFPLNPAQLELDVVIVDNLGVTSLANALITYGPAWRMRSCRADNGTLTLKIWDDQGGASHTINASTTRQGQNFAGIRATGTTSPINSTAWKHKDFDEQCPNCTEPDGPLNPANGGGAGAAMALSLGAMHSPSAALAEPCPPIEMRRGKPVVRKGRRKG